MSFPSEPLDGAVAVISKQPVPGRSKTRLCPPLTLEQAAEVAEAAARDTFAAVRQVAARRHVLVLEGEPGDWTDDGFEIIAQHGDGLAARLTAAFTDIDDNAIVIAMDTPQVDPVLLRFGLAVVTEPGTAAFGPAADGGYWLIGLSVDVDPVAVFDGIPMSEAWTGEHQLARLHDLGLRVTMLPELRDIDLIDDVWAVASNMDPDTHVARLASELSAALQ